MQRRHSWSVLACPQKPKLVSLKQPRAACERSKQRNLTICHQVCFPRGCALSRQQMTLSISDVIIRALSIVYP